MKTILPLFFVFFALAANAAPVKLYKARIYTRDGVKKGILEKVNDQYVCLSADENYLVIPVSKIQKISLKAIKNTAGYKIMEGASKGASAAGKAWHNERQAYENASYGSRAYLHQPDAADAAGSLITNAVAGGIIGSLKALNKSVTFTTRTFEEYCTALPELSRYAAYNQQVPLSPLPPLK